MKSIAWGCLALLAIPLCAQVPAGAFQVRYASNLLIGDSVVNFTNTGEESTSDGLAEGGQQNGNICVNVYTYSPDEQLVSCCSCLVTPNGLVSMSVRGDLVSNTLTPIQPSSVVIKLLASRGDNAACTASSAATVGTASENAPAGGMLAWGTTLHFLPVTPGSPAGTLGLTETAFSRGKLVQPELVRMRSLCAFIRANGSGYGICKNCRFGGLGASSK